MVYNTQFPLKDCRKWICSLNFHRRIVENGYVVLMPRRWSVTLMPLAPAVPVTLVVLRASGFISVHAGHSAAVGHPA